MVGQGPLCSLLCCTCAVERTQGIDGRFVSKVRPEQALKSAGWRAESDIDIPMSYGLGAHAKYVPVTHFTDFVTASWIIEKHHGPPCLFLDTALLAE